MVRAAGVPPVELRRWGDPDLCWVVTAYRAETDGGGALVRCLTNVPVTNPLRVLVRVPVGAADIGAAICIRGQHTRMSSTWGPCIIVPPDRHAPELGRYSLSDWPLVTFDGDDRGSNT